MGQCISFFRSEIMNEERAFLMAILERPDDDARKLVYADWLEERGDPRGEYLRLMMKVRQERTVTQELRRRHNELSTEFEELRTRQLQAGRGRRRSSPENRERQRRVQELGGQLSDLSKQLRQRIPTRLQELAAAFDPNWLAVVSDPEIEGCGKSAREAWRLRFDLVCDKTWGDLQPTGNRNLRHCESCGQKVHFCDNLADAREHALEGHCIAVDLGVIRRENDLVPPFAFAGRVSRAEVRESYEEGIDPVSQARLEARKQGRKD
jgi:uncharacterized protein (TIGR02996 family)